MLVERQEDLASQVLRRGEEVHHVAAPDLFPKRLDLPMVLEVHGGHRPGVVGLLEEEEPRHAVGAPRPRPATSPG
jgi:hypothetical protein